MASDWQVGDLALCISDGPKFHAARIFEGRTYTVAEVVFGTSAKHGETTGLVLAEMKMPRGMIGVCHQYFRKIRPDEHEACEPEFVTLLKRNRVSA